MAIADPNMNEPKALVQALCNLWIRLTFMNVPNVVKIVNARHKNAIMSPPRTLAVDRSCAIACILSIANLAYAMTWIINSDPCA